MVLQSVQASYKILRSNKPILPIHRIIVPPMEIIVNSRLKPARCNDCTNPKCILTESLGCREVKNVVLQAVETANKLLRATKQFLLIHRGIAPPMEILVNSVEWTTLTAPKKFTACLREGLIHEWKQALLASPLPLVVKQLTALFHTQLFLSVLLYCTLTTVPYSGLFSWGANFRYFRD